uniref:Uncharacterized protein n=1 Tax=Oryza brachyantha TaxID=4533 RepID=J3N381_ORYBR
MLEGDAYGYLGVPPQNNFVTERNPIVTLAAILHLVVAVIPVVVLVLVLFLLLLSSSPSFTGGGRGGPIMPPSASSPSPREEDRGGGRGGPIITPPPSSSSSPSPEVRGGARGGPTITPPSSSSSSSAAEGLALGFWGGLGRGEAWAAEAAPLDRAGALPKDMGKKARMASSSISPPSAIGRSPLAADEAFSFFSSLSRAGRCVRVVSRVCAAAATGR